MWSSYQTILNFCCIICVILKNSIIYFTNSKLSSSFSVVLLCISFNVWVDFWSHLNFSVTGLFYFLLVFVPHRAPPPRKDIHTNFACNTQDSYFNDCHDAARAVDCSIGMTSFANSTDMTKLNKSLSCFVSCQPKSDANIPNFQACFTNNTAPYRSEGCNPSDRTHINFTIPDLKELIRNEIIRDRQHLGSTLCLDYDAKNLHFGETGHEALQILCDRELLLDCLLSCSQSQTCKTNTNFRLDTTFCVFFFIFLVANIMFAPIFPILDAAAYDNLGEDRHLWGKQRMWGTLGFILFAVTSTFIMNMQEAGSTVDYSVSFYVFLPLTIIAAFIANFLTMSEDIR